MARPKPCVLFAQSFLHPVLAEYVDEVRFTEPVVISACEFLELHTTSVCPTLSLSGASFPQSFALEIFVRIGGEARFKRLCPAFLYSPSASSILEVQAAVTDHMVIRGSYRALSLVVYGNSVKELGQFNFDHEIDNTLSDAIIPPEAVFQPEDLPEALQDETGHQNKVLPPLRNLHLINQDVEQSEAIYELLSLALQLTRSNSGYVIIRRVFDILLSTASAILSELGIENGFPQWPTTAQTPFQSQRKIKEGVMQARDQVRVVYGQCQIIASMDESPVLIHVSVLLEEVFGWIQRSFQLSSNMESDVSVEEYLMAGLAAVQLLCMDGHWCFQLVVAGGLNLLMSVLQYTSSESSAIALLILGGLKCACQHAFACEALLGWWPGSVSPVESKHTLSFGYCSVLRMLLQTKRQNVSQLASQVLHHLHAYRLASEFECEVESLIENASGCDPPALSEHSLKQLSSFLQGLLKALNARDFLQDCYPAQTAQWSVLDGDDTIFALPPNAIFSWIFSSKFSFAFKDLDSQILLVMQERRFVPALAAVLSAPCLRAAAMKMKDSFLEFIGTVEAIILSLINSRSGLLFLASDQEEAAALTSALMGIEEHEGREFIDFRHACSLTSSGLICKTQDVGHMLFTTLSVIAVLDRLLETNRHSEKFLWLLWELSVFSRSEAGKQALSSIAFFPEVFVLLLDALQLDSQSLTTEIREVRALNRAFIHSAAEVMQVILIDPIPSTLAAWVPHALSLQKALQYCSPTTIDIAVGGSQGLGSNSKDALCARLLDWVDAAVIFHKKGPVGLLRYVAALVVGSVTSVAVGGLPTSDPVDNDTTFGESAVSTELPPVNTLLGRGVTLGAAGTVLPDTAVVQLTVSMRIMSSISCHPGMAAVLFGEGAMSVLYILLEYGSAVLQSSTFDYDYMVEEDGEGDGITEMILEQERELSLLGLMLPTLFLLLSLLNRLQVTCEEYRNTRLVETLLQLHRCICSRLASKISVFPQATGTSVLASVLRVIASILAFWPVSGWMPSIFPKLLGLNTSSLIQTPNLFPLEPKEAVSVMWILADMLPEEVPQLCTNTILSMDVARSLAVATLLGTKSMKVVKWHCQAPMTEKLIQAMGLHLDHISFMVLHLASTTSALLQGVLTKLVVRMACQNQDHAATLLRPILTSVKEFAMSSAVIAENELFRVEQFLKLLRELVRRPETKSVMIQEGIVQALLQAGKERGQSAKEEVRPWVMLGSSATFGLQCLILDILVAICDPDISLLPSSPINCRLAKDCPGFTEYCTIAAWAYNFMLSMPLGKELDVAVSAFCKIASHQLGRAAFATIALSVNKNSTNLGNDTSLVESLDIDTPDAGHQTAEGIQSLVPFCKRLVAALSESAEVYLVLEILQQFSVAAIQLSAAGRSTCGLGALQLLFEVEKMETKEILTSAISLLKSWADGDGDKEMDNVTMLASLKALKSVTALLRLLDNLPEVMDLEKKVKLVVDKLQPLQLASEKDMLVDTQFRQWNLLPQLFFEVEDTKTDWDPMWSQDTDDIFGRILKDKFVWECPNDVSDKPLASISGKKKAANTVDGGSKKHNVDGGINGPAADVASSVNGNVTGRSGTLSSASTSTRRDSFRQRKPNTSRPPSMHVDDYVARERGSEPSTGLSGGISQRSALGGGRPPSIHVDEFMARQRDRHLVVGAPTSAESQPPVVQQALLHVESTKSESSINPIRMSRPVMPEEDIQDVDIELDGVPDTDDLLSLPSGSEFVVSAAEGGAVVSGNVGKASMEVHLSSTSLTVSIEPGKQVLASENMSADDTLKSMQTSTRPQHKGISSGHRDGGEANMQRSSLSDSLPSTSLNLKVQMQQGMETASTVGVSFQVQEQGRTSYTTPVSHIGERGPGGSNDTGSTGMLQQRNQLHFIAAPPLPPPLPPPPPIPAGVIPEKFEVSSGGSKMPPLLPSSAPVVMTTVAPPPPPPPRPSGTWQPADSNLGQAQLTPMSSLTFGTGPVGHLPNPQIGTVSGFAQVPLPPWPPLSNEEPGSLGAARVAPPLPPTPPPFSSTQIAVLQAPILPNTVLNAPSPYQNLSRVPPESTSIYTSSTTMESPSLERNFSTFSPPPIAQGTMPHPPTLLPTFQPPLPPGRPNVSQAPSVPGTPVQQQFQPSGLQPVLQPAPSMQFSAQPATALQPFQQPIHQTPPQQVSQPPQQQEPGNLLQQILASPAAIQDLLKDQNKLQSLLEQHPKLISLLQEKMGQS